MAAFRKRPPFSSVEEYEKFMKDPTRVVRLEWRKARRQQHKGLTSHSWLDAELLEGERLRLEFFADTGLTESLFAAGKGERESTLYENRVAGPGDFSRPLTAKLLRRVAEKAAVRPYSLTDWNCHHFVLEVWNSVVIAVLRRSHYPDRVKTNMLWGASETVGKLWTNLMTGRPEQRSLADERGDGQPGPLGRMLLGSFSSNAGIDMADSADRTPLTRTRSTASSLPQSMPSGDLGEDVGGSDDPSPDGGPSAGSRHVTLQAHQEEGDRISGEVEAVPSLADEDERNWQFSRAVQEGNIFLLSTENGLVTADMPAEAQRTRHAWAQAWLPFLGSSGLRMADHLGCTDTVELVVRVLGNDGAQAVARQRQREAARTPFASLNSESLASNGGERSRVTSSCFVVLLGSEIRLVVYATLGSKPVRRLRLLSGNLHEWRESSFNYTLMETSPEQPVGSAKEWLKEELESLRFALSTGDWGFVTLL